MGNGEGLGEALKYVGELKNQVFARDLVEVDGRRYACGDLRAVYDPVVKNLEVTTLTGVVEYLKHAAEADGYRPENVLVHVVSPVRVEVRSAVFGSFRQRETVLVGEPVVPEFGYDRFLSNEAFIIGLNAMFVQSPDRDALLRTVAAIKVDAGADIVDDGVSQKTSMSVGARLVSTGEVKPRWVLEPYCTFQEIAPQQREFLLRLNDKGQPGLFVSDGGAWRGPTMQRIKAWLDTALNGTGEGRLESPWRVVA